MDVIIARAFNSGAIGTSIKAAKDAGIPFITFDRGSTSGKPTAHVGGDSYDQARSTGLAFADILKKAGVQGKCIELARHADRYQCRQPQQRLERGRQGDWPV